MRVLRRRRRKQARTMLDYVNAALARNAEQYPEPIRTVMAAPIGHFQEALDEYRQTKEPE